MGEKVKLAEMQAELAEQAYHKKKVMKSELVGTGFQSMKTTLGQQADKMVENLNANIVAGGKLEDLKLQAKKMVDEFGEMVGKMVNNKGEDTVKTLKYWLSRRMNKALRPLRKNDFTPEQIQVLKGHGIDLEKGTFKIRSESLSRSPRLQLLRAKAYIRNSENENLLEGLYLTPSEKEKMSAYIDSLISKSDKDPSYDLGAFIEDYSAEKYDMFEKLDDLEAHHVLVKYEDLESVPSSLGELIDGDWDIANDNKDIGDWDIANDNKDIANKKFTEELEFIDDTISAFEKFGTEWGNDAPFPEDA